MWNKITVGQYQAFYSIITDQTYEHELDRQIDLLAALTGLPASHYEAMPVSKLQAEVEKTRFLHDGEPPAVKPPRYLHAGGNTYQPIYDFRQLVAGQFIDAMSCVKEPTEHVNNMHRMLAAICRPTKRGVFGRKLDAYGAVPFAEVAEAMKSVPMPEAQGVALFFWNVWTTLLKSMPDFLVEKQVAMSPKEMELWQRAFPGDGVG